MMSKLRAWCASDVDYGKIPMALLPWFLGNGEQSLPAKRELLA